MKTANGNPNGIVRFDSSGGQTVRFATGTDFTQVALGLDGNLYGLANPVQVQAFDPDILQAGGNGGYAPGRAGFRHPQHRCRFLREYLRGYRAGTSSNTTGTVTSWRAFRARSSDRPGPAENLMNIVLDTDGQIAVGGRNGEIYLTDESLTTVQTIQTNQKDTFVTFNQYISPPGTEQLVFGEAADQCHCWPGRQPCGDSKNRR